MKITLKNQINHDQYTDYVFESFDIEKTDEKQVVIDANLEKLPDDFNIGVVYGGSGTGKTTILKNYFNVGFTAAQFDNSKSLISNFDWMTPEEAGMLLSAMGLASVPTWLRPHNVLSNGEQYRAELAYVVGKAKPGEVVLIDEYTSVVDRDVAKAMSNALQKYVRRYNKKIVLASCHFDIIDWLQPDWVYSPQKGRLETAPSRRRPTIELQIFRCRYETWEIFKHHHYLSHDLNKAAKSFVVLWNDKPVGFMAILPFPHGSIQNGYRISRVVVLPDFQGLGIGFKLIDYFASLYKADDKNMYIKTSNPALFGAMKKNEHRWKLVNEVTKDKLNSDFIKKMQQSDKGGILGYRNAITKSFKYIGPPSEESTDVITFNADAHKDVAQNQLDLFDLIELETV